VKVDASLWLAITISIESSVCDDFPIFHGNLENFFFFDQPAFFNLTL
jgi:hypothetical protein